MKASRLVRILLLLQIRERMTAGELAAELEVSERTVYRDLAALAEAGVPVYSEPGPYGGARLVDGYRTRLTGLSRDEASSLFLAGLSGAASQLGLGTVVAAAQLKVLAALPPELRGRAARVLERFHVDAPAWFRTEEVVPELEPVAEAVWSGRRAVIRYRGRRHTVRRTIDPLGLVLKAGRWYVVATHRGALRTFRIGRVERVDVLEVAVRRPEGFDLAAAWAEASRGFVESLQRYPVTARMTPAGLALFRRVIAPAAARDVRVGELVADGMATVDFLTESEDVAHGELLRLGAEAVVVAPLELRDRLGRSAADMACRYAGVPISARAGSSATAASGEA